MRKYLFATLVTIGMLAGTLAPAMAQAVDINDEPAPLEVGDNRRSEDVRIAPPSCRTFTGTSADVICVELYRCHVDLSPGARLRYERQDSYAERNAGTAVASVLSHCIYVRTEYPEPKPPEPTPAPEPTATPAPPEPTPTPVPAIVVIECTDPVCFTG